MNLLLEKLKNIVEEQRAKGYSDIVIINSLKEYLQYAVLDFVYHNAKYSHLVMYGGTLLRICYDLERMSEDLDFQTSRPFPFEEFKEDIIQHFKGTYDLEIEVKTKAEKETGTEVTFLKFNILPELGITGTWQKLKLRFDVNNFEKMDQFQTEVIPKSKNNFTFAIRTYPISTLMASKIAAVLLRNQLRNIKGEITDHKPRDIYDLMWYMDKKIIPNLAYLKAKGIEVKNQRELFDTIALKVMNLADNLFQKDLGQFFYRQDMYDDWFRNWRERFITLRNSYEIHEIIELAWIRFGMDPMSENRYFHFVFKAKNEQVVKFTFILASGWYLYAKKREVQREPKIEEKISEECRAEMNTLDYQYIDTFYKKIARYLEKNDHIVLQSKIESKMIRYTADKLDTKSQILLDERLLESVNLEDLL
jgi:predicted nucleotidyltransferase component of viral defense system